MTKVEELIGQLHELFGEEKEACVQLALARREFERCQQKYEVVHSTRVDMTVEIRKALKDIDPTSNARTDKELAAMTKAFP